MLDHIGVDATALVENRTGVGNYLYPILHALCTAHSEVCFSLYSNAPIFFPALPNVVLHVSSPRRRGPWWQFTHLRQMLSKNIPQVYWGSNGLLPYVRCSKVPTVLTVHDLVYRFAARTLPLPSYWGRRWLQPRSAALATRLVAVSHATAQDIQHCYGRAVNAVVSPCPAPVFALPSSAEKARVARTYQLPSRFWLSLGTMEPRKNIHALLQAYALERQTNPNLLPLILVGGAGWKDHAIQQAIAQAEQAGHVRWLSYVDTLDLPAFYALCDAFLMPSIYEGFGMPVLEAQLCGAPVVHGHHASMCEAGAQLGTAVGTSVTELQYMLRDLSAGALPLTCRLPTDFHHSVQSAAETMWQQFQAAVRSSPSVAAA